MPGSETRQSPDRGGHVLKGGTRWSTERKVLAGFAFALGCLAIVGVMSYLSVVRLRANEAWVKHTREVLSKLELCLSTTTDAETAERGYVIAGDEGYLEPYRQAAERIGGVRQQLHELIRDNPVQEQHFRELDTLIGERLRALRHVIELRKTYGFEAAQREILKGQGKLLHDQIRHVIDAMAETEGGLLQERELRTRRSTVLTQAVIISGGLGAFVIVGLAMVAIRRDFAGRQRAERALQEANEQLEARVQERTAEVARAGESLRASERRFRALIEHSSDSITLVDAHNNIIYLSPAVAAVAGYTPEERVGQSAMENIHPDDVARLRGIAQQLLVEPGTSIPLQWRGRHKSGQWVWLEGVGTNLLHDPAVQAIVINYRDITERKQSEDRLQAQLARLALLSEITRAIAERQDVSSIFQVVIRTLEEHLAVDLCCIFRFEPGEKSVTVSGVGVHSRELAMELGMTEQASIEIDENGLSRCVNGVLVYEPDISEVAFPFPQRLARGGLRSMVAAPLRVESQVFGVVLTARRQASSFSSGECEFLRQVSEHAALAAQQAQLYGALQRAYDDLRQTQQSVMQQERLLALGKMASGIAHDINNAISPVTLYAEALLEQEPGLSPRARGYLETILRAIEDVAHTVARMREFYRQRESVAAMLPVDLNRLVLQVVELTHVHWSDMAQQRGIVIEVRTELAPVLPPILGIESEIRDALINLVFNAVDAMPHGGPLTLRTALRSEAGENSGKAEEGVTTPFVQLEIVDTGVGMDEDIRRRCLEPFFTTKGERGTGLGLAMVYGTMQRHGADLEIVSRPGEGTTVRLRFAAATMAAEASGATATVPIIPSLRILVVDDDPLVLNSLRDTLEADGHVVTVADGGQAGIDAFLASNAKGSPFPVVITDLGMPYVDGRKVSSAVKIAAPETMVVMLTGWGQRLVADGDIPPHVDRVLGKPPKLREIRTALVEYVVEKGEGLSGL